MLSNSVIVSFSLLRSVILHSVKTVLDTILYPCICVLIISSFDNEWQLSRTKDEYSSGIFIWDTVGYGEWGEEGGKWRDAVVYLCINI